MQQRSADARLGERCGAHADRGEEELKRGAGGHRDHDRRQIDAVEVVANSKNGPAAEPYRRPCTAKLDSLPRKIPPRAEAGERQQHPGVVFALARHRAVRGVGMMKNCTIARQT